MVEPGFLPPQAGGESELLAPTTSEFTLDGDALYFANGREITRLSGGALLPLARIEGSLGGIVAAGGYLYWGDFNQGTVWQLPL